MAGARGRDRPRAILALRRQQRRLERGGASRTTVAAIQLGGPTQCHAGLGLQATYDRGRFSVHQEEGKPCNTASDVGAFTLAVSAALTAGRSRPPAAKHRTAYAAHASSATITVVEHAITDTEIPTGGGKDVKGNILTFNNPVFNTANKTQVGHDEGFCTRIQPKQHIWECLWTTFLRAGQITVQGPYYDNRNSVLSITGGTGAFRDSRGQMLLNARDGGKEYDFIFHLS